MPMPKLQVLGEGILGVGMAQIAAHPDWIDLVSKDLSLLGQLLTVAIGAVTFYRILKNNKK